MATMIPVQGDGLSANAISPAMTTTAFDLPGYRVTRSFGVTRGITVRSRNIFAAFAGACAACCGGQNTIFLTLCEDARRDAFNVLLVRARQLGANAIIGMRYDANAIGADLTEVLAYGTAVFVEQVQS